MAVSTDSNDRKRRTESPETRRRQLMEATIASIAELGFADTTLEIVTKRAGLSKGTISFHFKSKDMLFAETLGYLAREHFDHWSSALRDAGPEPSDQLAAIIKVDFEREICSPKKLAVWFSFWGQVKYRPTYLKFHDKYDQERFATLEGLCRKIIQDGGYDHIDAFVATRRIEAFIDGLWLGMLLYPNDSQRAAARDDAFDFLALLFPRHFPRVTSIPCQSVESSETATGKG